MLPHVLHAKSPFLRGGWLLTCVSGARLRRRFEEKVVHGERPHTSSTRPAQPKSHKCVRAWCVASVMLTSTAVPCSEPRPSVEERAEETAEVSPKEMEDIFLPRSTLGQLVSL